MRPLVLVARDAKKAGSFIQALSDAGAQAVAIAVIRTAPPSSWRDMDKALKHLAGFDAVAFASGNAVGAFFTRAKHLRLGKLKVPKLVLAVGPATAKSLTQHGWKASLVTSNPGGKNLARSTRNIRGLRVLVPRAKEGRDELINGLRQKGALVRAVEAYRTIPDSRHKKTLHRVIKNKRLVAAAFFSGSAVDSFKTQVGKNAWNALRRHCLFAALGPTASQALRALSARKIIQSSRADVDALARLLCRALAY